MATLLRAAHTHRDESPKKLILSGGDDVRTTQNQPAPAAYQTAAELTKILEFFVSAGPHWPESPGFMSNPGSVLQCRHQENQLHPNPPTTLHKSPVHAAFPDPEQMDQG